MMARDGGRWDQMPEPMIESFFTIVNGKDGDMERTLVWRSDWRHHDLRNASVARVQSAGAKIWPLAAMTSAPAFVSSAIW